MESGYKGFKGTYFYIAVAGIFLIIISPSLLSEGMFMDGMMYATMSKNLANGLGTFWQSHFSEIIFPSFINHPPLAIGLESTFFRIFGDSRFVERFYSLFAILLTGLIIVKIWKSLGRKSSTGWLPLLFWIAMPSVTWASVNNMLENTMGIFICLSVLFFIKSQKNNRILFLFLSGFMLSFGFLTKGFVTFFPLSFPFFYWLFTRKCTFWSVVSDTLLILFSSALPLVLLFLFIPGYRETLPDYLTVTFGLIANEATKASRFYIVFRLLMELLPLLGMIMIFLLYCRKKKLPLNQLSSNLHLASSFLCLGLSGVLPIMITRVQSGYYLLTSLPFFAISLSLMIIPHVETLMERINSNPFYYKLLTISGITLLSTGIILSVCFSGHINRNKDMIKDMRVITAELPEGITVNILPDMWTDWNLHTCYARYKNISLDPDLNNKHGYLLIRNSLNSDTLNNGFEKIELKTTEFELFRRKMPE
ncbi:MAG: glycosyltransferase family 39 protein [Bacteroidia bacterium]|nr:glycosyltransferase family 39 protein [Bacteroidia bacterium]